MGVIHAGRTSFAKRSVAASVTGPAAAANLARRPPDAVGVLRTLEDAGVRYVLIGELAEVLRGSPLLPLSATVSIVLRAGEGEALRHALIAGRGRDAPVSTKSPIDAVERWRLEAFGAHLTTRDMASTRSSSRPILPSTGAISR